MLDYNDFKNEYTKALQSQLALTGAVLEPKNVQKINEVKEGLLISFPDQAIAPTVYVDDAYHEHMVSGRSVQDLAQEQVEVLKNMKHNKPPVPEFTPEEARTRLYASLINKEKNEELLKNVPHKVVADDLAIVARYQAGDNASFLVKSDLCGILKMTPEEIIDIARKNTREKGFSCRPMGDVLTDLMMGADVPEDYKDDLRVDLKEEKLYVLTNKEKYDGAVLGTDKEVMSEIHNALGEDFYVLPSSRHELLIVPESMGMDPRELEDMVRSVNRMEVSSQDFLSDHVFHFGKSFRLERADSMQLSELPKMELDKKHGRIK